jgi:hypothetical protein
LHEGGGELPGFGFQSSLAEFYLFPLVGVEVEGPRVVQVMEKLTTGYHEIVPDDFSTMI